MPVIDARTTMSSTRRCVVLTAQALLTVRKTTGPPVRLAPRAGMVGDTVGRYFYRLVDDIADRYLDLVDGFEDRSASSRTASRSGRQNGFVGCADREQILHVADALPLRDG